MLRIYLAGPISTTSDGTAASYYEIMASIRTAMKLGSELIARGFAPFIPHLDVLLNLSEQVQPDAILKVDLAWLEVADVLFVFGLSTGVKSEIAFARKYGIPIVYSMNELIQRCMELQ